jgi:hypothetical protein
MAHDYSGYLMMPLALVLVGLEILILSWLAGPQRERDSGQIVLAVIPQAGSGKPKPKTPDNDL